MRRDDSLGQCINSCGRDAAYPSTMECTACYRRRRRKGIPPTVVGTGIHNYNYARKPLESRSDGRPSVYTQRLLTDARRAFLASNEPMFAIATASGKLKALIRGFMDEFHISEDEATAYALMNNYQRETFRAKHQN